MDKKNKKFWANLIGSMFGFMLGGLVYPPNLGVPSFVWGFWWGWALGGLTDALATPVTEYNPYGIDQKNMFSLFVDVGWIWLRDTLVYVASTVVLFFAVLAIFRAVAS